VPRRRLILSGLLLLAIAGCAGPTAGSSAPPAKSAPMQERPLRDQRLDTIPERPDVSQRP